MSDGRGRDGAWLGMAVVTATAMTITDNPWWAMLMLCVLLVY